MCMLASDIRSPLLQAEESSHQISIKADDYPVLKEGFELCGRYNLQEFFNEKLQEFNNQNNQELIHEESDRGEHVFDTLTHAIVPAQDLIVKALSEDKASMQRFCKILDEILENNLDLNSNPGFFACKKLLDDSNVSDNDSDDDNEIIRCWGVLCRYPSCIPTSCRNYLYCCTAFEKFANHATDQFFQYCIKVDFMNSVIQKYIDEYKDENRIGLIAKTIIKNNPEIMQLLIDKGIDIKKSKIHIIESCIGKQFTIFEFAMRCSADKVIPILARYDQNDLVQEELWKAVKLNNSCMIESLIFSGAKVNAVDEQGNTPLHCAAKKRYNAVIRLLIAAGANLHAENNDGNIPWNVVGQDGNLLESQTTRNLLKPISVHNKKSCTIS